MCRLAHAGFTSAATERTTDGKAHEKETCFKMACVVSRGEQEDRGETTERQVEIHSDA